MKNRRGAEFSIRLLIAIVLGILVLAIIALGFIGGWNNLLNKFKLYGRSDDLSSAGQSCQVACSTQSETGYCTTQRSVSSLSADQVGKFGTIADDKFTAGNELSGITAEKKGDVWTLKGVTCVQLKTAGLLTEECDIVCS